MQQVDLRDLLDEERFQDFLQFWELSFKEPVRFVCWTPTHRKLVILDLDEGRTVKAWYANIATEEAAERAIAELAGSMH